MKIDFCHGLFTCHECGGGEGSLVIVAKGNGDIEKSKTNAPPIVIRDNGAPWNLSSSLLHLSRLVSALDPFAFSYRKVKKRARERENSNN